MVVTVTFTKNEQTIFRLCRHEDIPNPKVTVYCITHYPQESSLKLTLPLSEVMHCKKYGILASENILNIDKCI